MPQHKQKYFQYVKDNLSHSATSLHVTKSRATFDVWVQCSVQPGFYTPIVMEDAFAMLACISAD
jgi:hypothetical protein